MSNTKPQLIHCPLCGFNFQKNESRKHGSYCRKYLRACVKFDEILHHAEFEAIKREADQVLSDANSSVPDQVAAAEKLLQAYFSQSVTKANFNLKHPNRSEFYATILRKHAGEGGVKVSEEARRLLLKKMRDSPWT